MRSNKLTWPEISTHHNFDSGCVCVSSASARRCCCAPPAIRGQSQEPIDTIKIDTNLISVPVIVSDRDNRYVPDLKVEAFAFSTIRSNKRFRFSIPAKSP